MKKRSFLSVCALSAIAFSIYSCGGGGQPDNTLSDKEKNEGWVLLFDGSSTRGWHAYNNDTRALTWSVQHGELVCGPDIRYDHIDLVSDKEYKNYDVVFDWKINKGGNSGMFINVVERPDLKATWASGPEYQMLESTHPDISDPKKLTGGIFGFVAQHSSIPSIVAGQWYHSEIKQKDGHVEFLLNGEQTYVVDLTSAAWADSVSKTHFAVQPEFGKHTSGHLALQDWQKEVAFKNIKIKEL